jgi:hypothetical protein
MKTWLKITLGIMGLFIVLGVIGSIANPSDSKETGNVVNEQITEMSMEEVFNLFNGLSEIQQKEKIEELKGKRIKTSIYASKIDQASLSTQYVVIEMYDYPYSSSPYAKAFFPNEEKDNLLKANIGDTIVFSGEFVTYHEGALTSYVEFTNSKFIELN